MKNKLNILEDKATEAINRLRVSRNVVYDCETSGLDWKRNAIVGHVLTFGPRPQDSYYIPVRHAGNKNLSGVEGLTTPFNWDKKIHKFEKAMLAHLNQSQNTLTFHNGGFDLKFLSQIGFTFEPRCEDTFINEALINEYAGKFSLEACCIRHGVQAKKGQLMYNHLAKTFSIPADQKSMGSFWRLSGDDVVAVEYAEGDGTSTWQLRDAQMLQIRKQETWRGEPVPTLEKVWDIESRLIPVLARMTVKGIKIDEEALSKLKAHIKSELERLYNALPDGFSARSPVAVRQWMEDHGQTDWPMTAASKRFPKGQPSFTQGWLENSDAGKQIIQVRKFETLRDTFVMPLQTTHLFNGRVHPDFNQLRGDEFGTITGRLSCNNPNLQAVPKHDDETQVVPMGPLYRRVFIPDEGKIWGNADYSQIEPRLLAYYSGCKALIKGYTSDPPVDAHTVAAQLMNKNWNKLSEKEQKWYRGQYSKRINMTVITGGGKGVLVSKYKVPASEVDEAWSLYHRAMPEIKQIQGKMSRRFRERGYMVTLLGRRCRIDDPNRDYVALNRILQAGNADVIKSKLVEVDEYLRSVGRPLDILNNIHDDVAFQFSEDARPHYQKCLDIMQSFGPDDLISLSLPLPVDAGEGPDWGTATYGEHK